MILIAQISDLHLVPEGTLCYGRVDTNALARRTVAAVNRLETRPDAVVVTGDVIETAKAEDYAVARDILGQLKMPFYLVSGNHDDSTAIKSAFCESEFADAAISDRLCYAADIGHIRLVVLDSSVPRAPHGALSSEQLSFLDRELAAAKDRPVVVAVHHPPIATGNRVMDGFALTDAAGFAAVISRHQNVQRIFCGHCHRTIIGAFAGSTVVIAPATGHQLELALDHDDTFGYNLEPPAFLLHRWTETDGLTTQIALVDRYPGPYLFSWDRASTPSSEN